MSYEKVKQAKELFIGTKQTYKAIEEGLVSEIFIARDADIKVIGKIVELSQLKECPIYYVDSMKKLGKASGIEVGAAAVAIKK